MAEQLNPNNYSAINDEINTILTSGAYSGITITVFSDSAMQNVLTTNEGPIQNKTISQISHTATHIDNNSLTVPATITLQFNDGTSVTAVDGVDSFWYLLTGVVFQPRAFGTL